MPNFSDILRHERNLQTNAGSRGSVRIRRTFLFWADPDMIYKFEISAFSLAKPINQLTFLSETTVAKHDSVRIHRTFLFRADPDMISKFEISAFSLAKPINQLTFFSKTTVAKHDSLSLSDASPLSYVGRPVTCNRVLDTDVTR